MSQLIFDCKTGYLSFPEVGVIGSHEALYYVNDTLCFTNLEFFTLVSIKRLLTNYPDLQKLSPQSAKFLEVARAARPVIGVVTHEGSPLKNSRLRMSNDLTVNHNDHRTLDVIFPDDDGEGFPGISFKLAPGHEIISKQHFQLLRVLSSGEEYSSEYTNVLELFHLPIEVMSKTSSLTQEFGNAALNGWDAAKRVRFTSEEVVQDITLHDIACKLFDEIDVFGTMGEHLEVARERLDELLAQREDENKEDE